MFTHDLKNLQTRSAKFADPTCKKCRPIRERNLGIETQGKSRVTKNFYKFFTTPRPDNTASHLQGANATQETRYFFRDSSADPLRRK